MGGRGVREKVAGELCVKGKTSALPLLDHAIDLRTATTPLDPAMRCLPLCSHIYNLHLLCPLSFTQHIQTHHQRACHRAMI